MAEETKDFGVNNRGFLFPLLSLKTLDKFSLTLLNQKKTPNETTPPLTLNAPCKKLTVKTIRLPFSVLWCPFLGGRNSFVRFLGSKCTPTAEWTNLQTPGVPGTATPRCISKKRLRRFGCRWSNGVGTGPEIRSDSAKPAREGAL